MNQSGFILSSPDIQPWQDVPTKFAEESKLSPRLAWHGVPDGTRSFALSITDPDLPAEFNFPRLFAHWLVFNIPGNIRELPEGASGTSLMPSGSEELNSDFVTLKVPGFDRGYGGPWPPDRKHRYVFSLYALKSERLELSTAATLSAFSEAVLPVTIDVASFTALYGPARNPLPTS